VTHEDIVYDRRVRLIEYAARIGNVAEACRVFGVSRKTDYEWVSTAEAYGLSALLPNHSQIDVVSTLGSPRAIDPNSTTDRTSASTTSPMAAFNAAIGSTSARRGAMMPLPFYTFHRHHVVHDAARLIPCASDSPPNSVGEAPHLAATSRARDLQDDSLGVVGTFSAAVGWLLAGADNRP
jgi:hypothetical protein